MPDLVCDRDLDLFGRETDDPLEILGQDLYHRLAESYGSNPDDVDRGVGLGGMLSGALEDVDLQSAIESDFAKDDRVASSRATITPLAERGGYRIAIEVQAVDGILPLEAVFVDGVLTRVVT